MAITDNTFTAEEISAAVAANPNLRGIIRGLATEDKELSTNLESHFIGKKTSEFAQNIERDVLEASGEKKLNDDEKYYDYTRRVILKQKQEIADVQKQIDELKSKSSPSTADKEQIKLLEKKLEDVENEWKKKYSDKETELTTARLTGNFERELDKIRGKYNANIPESMIKLAEQAAVTQLLKEARVQEDGSVSYFDAEDKLISNTALKPQSTEERILALMKDVIDEGRSGKGAGTGKENQGGKPGGDDGKGKPSEFKGLPPEVKTKTQLTDHLHGLGIVTGTDEFDKIFEEHGKDLPLR